MSLPGLSFFFFGASAIIIAQQHGARDGFQGAAAAGGGLQLPRHAQPRPQGPYRERGLCSCQGAANHAGCRRADRICTHESGVHRVQRVPTTETQGRIHTSTATVAVLPEVDEVDVDIRTEDLRIDIFHSGGPGGQNVNKVATAVRVVHNPSGIVVVSQGERSQLRNKTEALSVLRSRLYEQQIREQEESTSAARRSQVGSGERSEKIRTYNFPQDRLTDHRINMSIHGLQEIMVGAGQFGSLVESLLQDEQARLLEQAEVETQKLV